MTGEESAGGDSLRCSSEFVLYACTRRRLVSKMKKECDEGTVHLYTKHGRTKVHGSIQEIRYKQSTQSVCLDTDTAIRNK